MRAKLSKLGTVITGNTPAKQESKYWASSDIPFIKPDVINQDGITELQGTNEYISEMARSKARIVEKGVVLVTCIGTIGKICLTGRECAFNQQINAIIPNDKVLPEYLAYCIYYNRPRLIELANAPVVPIINKRQFEDFSVNIEENIAQQGSIVTILKEVNRLIYYHQQQLQKLDELVKARFIELFGDPVRNSMGLPTEPMTTVCAIIDGDRGKNYPKQDEFSDTGYCLFLNAKNVTATGFSFENRMFITKEKDNALHNGKLERGDVVLTTRGTLGNLAFYDDSVPFENVRINSGMVILRMNKSVMTEVFFMEQFKLQLQSIKGKIASGSAQPQLPISTMNKIRILLAPMALQEQFAAFVEQTDKSKVAVQKALDEAQMLFDSLMQKYFG